MKLSRASSYALHALAYLAKQKDPHPVASHLIARASDTPERFLLKVLKPLTAARVLHSLKGPNGGYRLARPASKITLLDIIEAVDGPIRGQAPFDSNNGANPGMNRRLQETCDQAAEQVRRLLSKTTLAELAAKGR